jgi:hypothetical protein
MKSPVADGNETGLGFELNEDAIAQTLAFEFGNVGKSGTEKQLFPPRPISRLTASQVRPSVPIIWPGYSRQFLTFPTGAHGKR